MCSKSSCIQRNKRVSNYFFNKVSCTPPTCCFELNFWSSCLQLPRVRDYRQVPPCPFFYWSLGIETRTLRLENKLPTELHPSPFLGASISEGKRGSSDLLGAESQPSACWILITLIHSQPPTWLLWKYMIWFSLADARKQLKARFPPQSPEAAMAAHSAEFWLRLYWPNSLYCCIISSSSGSTLLRISFLIRQRSSLDHTILPLSLTNVY